MERIGGNGGLTLVEVLVALAILGSVLIAVTVLFAVGRRGIRGGRSMTRAVAIAESVLEELNGLGYEQLPEVFPSCCGEACEAATACTIRSDVDADAGERWGGLVADMLDHGYVAISLTPIGGSVQPASFSSGEGLRVRVRVGWREGRRERSVDLVTVRF